MEETNYTRRTIGIVENDTPPTPESQKAPTAEKGSGSVSSDPSIAIAVGLSAPEKSYIQKLFAFDTSKPQTMHLLAAQALYFLSWPVIFYAG